MGRAIEKGSSRNMSLLCPFESFSLASSHSPLVLWLPILVTDSRGRDSNRQSLKRCRWTGRVFSFLRSPGERLNSRAVSSPLFTSQRDCEMSGNIYSVGKTGKALSQTGQARACLGPALPTMPLLMSSTTDAHLLPHPPSCS